MGDDKKIDNPALPASARFDWSELRVFLEVAEHKSISAAAKSLGMSQPTASKILSDLEMRLNTQLLARTNAGVTLTEAGERIRELAMPMARAAAAIDREVRALDQKLEGRVRLAAPDGVLAYWVAPRAPHFQRAHPHITLSMDGGFWPDDPLRDEIDISLQFDERKFGEHVIEPLATIHYAPFATRRYLDLYGVPKNFAELASHRLIHHVAIKQQKQTWDPKAEAIRLLSAHNIETNSSAAMGMALLCDGGIAFMPTYVASYYENIVMIGEEVTASPVLYLAYDPRLARVARAAAVIEWLKSMFTPTGQPWFQADFVHPRDFALAPGAGRLRVEPPL